LIHARVISINFIGGELECRGNLSDPNVMVDTRRTGKFQQMAPNIQDKDDTRAKGWRMMEAEDIPRIYPLSLGATP